MTFPTLYFNFLKLLVISVFLSGIVIYKNISLFQIIFILLILISISFFYEGITTFLSHKFNLSDKTLVLLFVLALLSFFWLFKDINAWFSSIIKFFVCILIYFLTQIYIIYLLKRKNNYKILIYTSRLIFGMGIILSLSILIDRFNMINFDLLRSWTWWREVRFTGLYGEPNFCSVLLNISLAFLPFLFYFYEKRKIISYFLYLSFFLFCTAILLTGSRLGLLLLITNLILFFFYDVKINKKIKIKTIIKTLAISIILFSLIYICMLNKETIFIYNSLEKTYDFLLGNYINEKSSIFLRANLIIFNIKNILTNYDLFLIGVGFGNEKYYIYEFFKYAFSDLASHNIFFSIINELGIFGLIIFISFLIFILKYSRKLIKRANNKQEKAIFYSLYIVLFIIFINYLFLSDLYVNKIIWIIFGLIAGTYKYTYLKK